MKSIEVRRVGTFVVEETITVSVPDDFVWDVDDFEPGDYEIVKADDEVLDLVDADNWELLTTEET